MLRQHDCRFRDQPSHDRDGTHMPSLRGARQHRVYTACVAALPCVRAPQEQVCAQQWLLGQQLRPLPRVLIDDDGMGFMALLRDGLMGGAEEAAVAAADAFLHAVSTFRYHCVEQFGN